MKKDKYLNLWLAFVNILAKKGVLFKNLIDSENNNFEINYTAAWANVIIKARNISNALKIIENGLEELNFKVIFIDKIECLSSLIEYDEVNNNVLSEENWIEDSQYVFKISDKLFPY